MAGSSATIAQISGQSGCLRTVDPTAEILFDLAAASGGPDSGCATAPALIGPTGVIVVPDGSRVVVTSSGTTESTSSSGSVRERPRPCAERRAERRRVRDRQRDRWPRRHRRSVCGRRCAAGRARPRDRPERPHAVRGGRLGEHWRSYDATRPARSGPRPASRTTPKSAAARSYVGWRRLPEYSSRRMARTSTSARTAAEAACSGSAAPPTAAHYTAELRLRQRLRRGVHDATASRGATGMAMSPDGTTLYVAAATSNAVDVFARDPATGALRQTGCYMSEAPPGPCTSVAGLVECQATLAVLMSARRRGLSVLRLRQAM